MGIIPALSEMSPEQNPPHGPIVLDTLQLLLWSAALAFFGVFLAVPLRSQTIIREKLRCVERSNLTGTPAQALLTSIVKSPRSHANCPNKSLIYESLLLRREQAFAAYI